MIGKVLSAVREESDIGDLPVHLSQEALDYPQQLRLRGCL